MRSDSGRLAVALLLGAVGLWMTAPGFGGQRLAKKSPNGSNRHQFRGNLGPRMADIVLPPSDGPAAFLVAYDSEANLTPDTLQLYQTMVNTLNGYAVVPIDRLNYYSAVNNANDCAITGWQGMISGVQPNGNGHLVTVSIAPTLASDTYGQAAVILNSDYSETYQVNNDGSFEYVGFLDPEGLAGQMPSIAAL